MRATDWSVLIDPTKFPDDIWDENKQKPLLIDYATSDVTLDVITDSRQLKRIARNLKDHIADVYYFRDSGLDDSVIFGKIKSGEYFVLRSHGYCTGFPIADVTITFGTDPQCLYDFELTQDERNEYKIV
jgi:hypothetical protein